MNIDSRFLSPRAPVLILYLFMAAGGCDVETATVGDSNIKILGGKEGGAYQTLIEAFTERAAIYTNCDSDSENAECDPQIGNLAIEPITTSGSIENLQHLGMRLVEGSNVSESQHADPQPVDSCRNISENDESCKTFALVQNDVIYRAGQGDLQKVVFDATRSPKVYPSSFAKFDDLRVVLPMYDSFIQIVTAASGERVDNSDSNDCPEPVDQNFRSLCSKKIYLGNLDSVNRNHGMVLLGRHPELQGANKPKFICKNGDRLIDCEQGEVAPGDKWKEILAEKRNKACPLEDRLLANGAVHAYVISGTLKPIVNFQEFLLNAKCYRTNQEGGEQAPGGEDNANSTLPALPDDLKKYRLQLAIPELLIDGILSETETKERNWLLGVFGEQHQQKYPYYRKLESPSNLDGDKFPDQWRNYNFPAPMLAVTTYLVTTESDSDIRDVDIVRRLTSMLLDQWNNLMLSNPKLAPIEENLLRKPVPRHRGADQALVENEYIGQTIPMEYLIVSSLGFLFVLMFSPKANYNRMGDSYRKREAIYSWLRFIVKLVLSIVLMMLSVGVVQYLESIYAVGVNASDPIGNFNFPAAFLWMFTFVASGYENEIFPISPWSQLLVTLLALVGLGFPLAAIIGSFNKIRDLRQDRERGLSDTGKLRGHTLIFGWNSRGPGLVYTLTSRGSTHTGRIVIVAEIDEELPLKRWRLERRKKGWPYLTGWWFSFRRVLYIRADPAQRKTLEQAQAQHASCAIILAGEHDRDVLTALSLRKFNKNIFIVGELGEIQDQAHYKAEKVNQIVDPDEISKRLLAIACFGASAVDLALDALSPGRQGSEWYLLKAKVVARHLDGKSPTLEHYIRELSDHNISVVGTSGQDFGTITKPGSPVRTVAGQATRPLISSADLSRTLDPADYLICASKDFKSYKNSRRNRVITSLHREISYEEKSESIIPPTAHTAQVLVIGPEARANALAKYLRLYLEDSQVETLPERGSGDLCQPGEIASTFIENEKEWTHVVIMSGAVQGVAEFGEKASQADAQTILKTHLIHDELVELNKEDRITVFPHIVAEMLDADNRQLFEDAGADIIVPTSIVIERLLARLASGRGHVSSMLLDMISLENGVFIRSFVLGPEHALVGQTFADALGHFYTDGRVIGLLPKHPEEAMKNKYGDFSHHFYMCPAKKDLAFCAGDTVVVLAKSQEPTMHATKVTHP
jgi:voltage-gated potassium channel Kch